MKLQGSLQSHRSLNSVWALGPASQSAGPPYGPRDWVSAATTLRYYLCSVVSCRTEDLARAFFVPVMGVGLVQYGAKE